MGKRVDLHTEKKKPNLSIPVGKSIFINYPIHCANNFSNISREVTLFINKILTENKIDEKYLEEPKKERFPISIEESLVKKYKVLCDKYRMKGQLNYYSTPICKFIEEELLEEKNGKK